MYLLDNVVRPLDNWAQATASPISFNYFLCLFRNRLLVISKPKFLNLQTAMVSQVVHSVDMHKFV